jgi:hypothetical protein
MSGPGEGKKDSARLPASSSRQFIFIIGMNGYLVFLKSLSEYQQRAEIGRLAFSDRRAGSSLEADVLKDLAVFTFSETLGVDCRFWKFDLKHYAEEPDVIGAPLFRADQCLAPFSFHYEHLNQNLGISGIIYIDDDQSAMIGTLTCSSTQEQSRVRRRLALAGIDPETLKTVGHDVEMSRKTLYLDYIESLLPQQRRDAIYILAQLVWGTDNPRFLHHPKLAPELQRLGISELGIADRCHEVGPVEFRGGRCTATLTYPLYGEDDLWKDGEDDLGYYVEVHILARIGNKPSGGGDISIEEMWFRIDSINDPEEDAIPMLVP